MLKIYPIWDLAEKLWNYFNKGDMKTSINFIDDLLEKESFGVESLNKFKFKQKTLTSIHTIESKDERSTKTELST